MPKQQSSRWTEEEIALLRRLYPGMHTRSVAECIDRPYPAIRQKAQQLSLKKTDDYMRLKSSKFRPGHKMPPERRSNPLLAVGTERLHRGCLMRKTSETGNRSADWKYVHRIVWEEAHGPIPDGHCIIFKNGN